MKPDITRKIACNLIAALVITACSGGGADINAPVEKPAALRTDLQFGYYASLGNQPQETKAHVNLYHDMQFGGEQYTIDSIKYMAMPTMLGIQYWMYDAKNKPKPDAELQLRAYLTRLQASGALQYVTDVYPLDEPDLIGSDPADIFATNAMIRRVFAEFNMRPRLSVIYGDRNQWQGVTSYDDVGFDKYYAGSAIFFNGDYAKLKSILRPDQKIWLVPGGADPWRQDPTPFVNYAHGDPQVRGIIAFTWFNSPPNGDYGKGIGQNGMAKAYCQAGAAITNKNGAC
jgi:hypothetical protein